MRKNFNLSSLLFLFCIIFLSVGALSARFDGLPKMKKAMEAGEKYRIRSKGGARVFEGEKLKKLVERARIFMNIFLVLIPILILCAVASLKWEFHMALVGGACVIVAHLTGLFMLGWSNYTAMGARSGAVSIAFSMSILGIMPALYVLYMRHNKLKFHPDVPEY